jgi:hypothetical protein
MNQNREPIAIDTESHINPQTGTGRSNGWFRRKPTGSNAVIRPIDQDQFSSPLAA